MIKVMSLIIIGLLYTVGFAQPDAKDFRAKDTDGKEHHLYEYLDAGKYVLIKFTSTT